MTLPIKRSEPARGPSNAPVRLDDPRLYFSRELSWLEFNDRVLDEAYDVTNPLLERVKFVAIHGTNLDEYFMIRVAGLVQQVEAGVHLPSLDGRLPTEELHAISARLRIALPRRQALMRDCLLPELARNGIVVHAYDEIDEEGRRSLRQTFEERIFPVLTPLGVDQAHPFPYISNLSLSLGVELIGGAAADRQVRFARVKVPQSLPRFVKIPGPIGELHFVLLEEVISHNLDDLFPGMKVVSAHAFRVTRDADLDIQEDEAGDLLAVIESELRKRRFGEPVRLEAARSMPQTMRDLLLEALGLEPVDFYEIDGPLGISDFWSLATLDRPDLREPSFNPVLPPRLRDCTDMFAAIRQGDLLLHHPYDSFDPVVRFVEQAADDPSVLAIKQTLYRTSGTSPVVAALMKAVENGKQVAVVIELKARFDEENNIHWARRLERVGAHVIYGVPGLKTHSKVTLVVRDEPEGLRRYVHVGTGNYNEKTARIYTDFSLFTCRGEIGADVTDLFNTMTGFAKHERYRALMIAPTTMRRSFLDLIGREAEHARAGRPCGILAKMNSLCDGEIVRALYVASQAGVPIELLVRGICELRPGIPGISETIRVRSIVGRFLEHSRVFVFTNGGRREVLIGSADWMGRNFDRRVETVMPVDDPELQAMLCEEILATLLADTAKTRWMRSDGTYVRREPAAGELPFNAQDELLRRARSRD
ncbi:MAG TPA: polyphosphate kinase 1 [Candidatus Baltobacteraceae bacterium]|nr:polyphosphate kinase 1 [Candidatus Baltobacteraceae bacterium]